MVSFAQASLRPRGLVFALQFTGTARHAATMTSPLPVVCALLEDGEGQVLLAQRPAHKHLGLKWEFPGGKVEAGEAPEHALQRELREELGCAVTTLEPLPRSQHDYGTVVIEMMPFVCRLAPDSPAPVAHEHAALAWVRPEAFEQWDLAPADWPVVTAYRERSHKAGKEGEIPGARTGRAIHRRRDQLVPGQ